MSSNDATPLPPCSVPVSKDSLNPLSLAAMSGGEAVAKLLCFLKTMPGMNDEELFAAYVNNKSPGDERTGGYAPLHYACQSGHPEAVRLLLEAGANPNIQKNNGATALITACSAAGYADKEQLENYKQCVEYLLQHSDFDLELNDNSEEMRSPPWICVNREYREPDALLPLLNLMLAKGFDPNGTIYNMSALHMAISNEHLDCALALVRAGANLQTKCRKRPDDVKEIMGTWTALEASKMLCGAAFTRKLVEASVAAAAVAGSSSRSRAKKAAASGDIRKLAKLAKKAKDAGDSLIKAERWSNAAGAYQEALSYPKEALDAEARYCAMSNLTTCFCQLNQGQNAVENARQFCDEFPGTPGALYSLGQALVHPCHGRISKEANEEAIMLANKMERMLLENPAGGPFWFVGYSRNQLFSMAQGLKTFVTSYQGPKSPGVEAAEVAMHEFNAHGSIVKAARAVEEALKPENKHPNTFPIRALRGNIYYQWGRELIDSFSKGEDLSLPLSERIYEEGREASRLDQAREKFEVALTDFEFCAEQSTEQGWPQWNNVWNEALTLVVLGRFVEGCFRCADALRLRKEEEMESANVNDKTFQQSKPATSTRGNDDLILHIDMAFKISRVFTTQQAMEETYADAPCEFLGDGTTASSVLDKAVSMKFLDLSYVEDIRYRIACKGLSAEKVASIWARAIETEESAKAAYIELRSAAAATLEEFTLSLRQNMQGASSRVLGTIMKEALEWDPEVSIPKELSKVEGVLQPNVCGACGAANPAKSCPCGKAHYCGRDCQKKAWRKHKKACAAAAAAK